MVHIEQRICDHPGACIYEVATGAVDDGYYTTGTQFARFRCIEWKDGVEGKSTYLCYECMRTAEIDAARDKSLCLVVVPIPQEDKYVKIPIACP